MAFISLCSLIQLFRALSKLKNFYFHLHCDSKHTFIKLKKILLIKTFLNVFVFHPLFNISLVNVILKVKISYIIFEIFKNGEMTCTCCSERPNKKLQNFTLPLHLFQQLQLINNSTFYSFNSSFFKLFSFIFTVIQIKVLSCSCFAMEGDIFIESENQQSKIYSSFSNK